MRQILLLDAFALALVMVVMHVAAAPQQLDGGVYDSPGNHGYKNLFNVAIDI